MSMIDQPSVQPMGNDNGWQQGYMRNHQPSAVAAEWRLFLHTPSALGFRHMPSRPARAARRFQRPFTNAAVGFCRSGVNPTMKLMGFVLLLLALAPGHATAQGSK